MQIKKRDGTIVPFDSTKIKAAVLKALEAVGLPSESVADKIRKDVLKMLGDKTTTTVEDVQDLVEMALMKRSMLAAAKAYILYRDERARVRGEMHVRRIANSNQSVTDKSMLISSKQDEQLIAWDRKSIVKRLMDAFPEIDLEKTLEVAKRVEDCIISSGLKTVNNGLVRELTNNVLKDMGFEEQLEDSESYLVPKSFVTGLIESKINENSNIGTNNPEAVNQGIAEYVLKQFALDKVFSEDVKNMHCSNMLYLHDLGFPVRGYCGSHSIEYIKKYGLKGLNNLGTTSKPAKSASVLTGHLNTFLASMQAYYAGALGLGYINIFYAPMLIGMDKQQLHQVAQELVFNGSQNAFSRGGQSLHPDELIWVKRNGKYQSVRIGKFVDDYLAAHPDEVGYTEAYEVYKTEHEDIQAISFEKESGKVLDKQIMYVARMPHKGKMYRIHTSNGIVNITGDHSLFTFRGKGDIVPTKTKELKKGDFVVIPHRVQLHHEADVVSVLDYMLEDELAVKGFGAFEAAVKSKGASTTAVLAQAGATRYIMKDGKKYDKVRVSLARKFLDVESSLLSLRGDSQAYIPNKLPLTKELGYVCGLFCAEGTCNRKNATIGNTDNAILDKLMRCLDGMGYTWYTFYPGRQHGCTADTVDIRGILGVFIQRSCTDNKQKIVPDWLFTAPTECIDGFIDGFYDGEASNRTRKPEEWSVSNTSTRVIAGMSLLMLSKERETYVYDTTHPDRPTWNTVYELRGAEQRKVNPFTEYTTVDGFNTYKMHIPAAKREAVEWLIESDLSVSIIKKIEEYDYDGPVYDISVPGTEAFLGGIGSVFFKNTLFLDFNIHASVPSYLRDVPAIGPGGKYMFCKTGDTMDKWVPLRETTLPGGVWSLVLPGGYTKEGQDILVWEERDGKDHRVPNDEGVVLTYGCFEKEVQAFSHALLDVWAEGDANGHVFEFPKCDFHVDAEAFTDTDAHGVYMHACEVAAKNGSTYFVFDRDSVSLSSCCRLRQTIDDMSIIYHPEHLRTLGLQNVTINIPQAAYRAKHNGKGNLDGILEEIDKVMDVAVKAHLQKKAFLESIMKPGRPMAQVGKLANDGRPYMDLSKAMYIIGLIGVNDAVKYLIGKEMHESTEAMDMALRITGHMYLKCKAYTAQYGITFKLEESPAESAARKMAMSDLVNWHDDAVQVYKGGDEEHAYYTNSVHLSADAPVDLITRIEEQAEFNSIIEAGAITHVFLGEQRPDIEAIAKLVEKTFQRTQSAQLVFSPEFTYCNKCGKATDGIKTKCSYCGSTDVYGETRIVGYYSRLGGWNLSKLSELRARQRGNYKVSQQGD